MSWPKPDEAAVMNQTGEDMIVGSCMNGVAVRLFDGCLSVLLDEVLLTQLMMRMMRQLLQPYVQAFKYIISPVSQINDALSNNISDRNDDLLTPKPMKHHDKSGALNAETQSHVSVATLIIIGVCTSCRSIW